LLKGNEPVSLSGRAFDLVIALVERPGEVVSKSELIAKVWPETFVAEGNLKSRIAALRRVLAGGQPGDRYISTIVGRGYCLSRRSLGRVAEARALPRRSGFVECATIVLDEFDLQHVDGRHLPETR
jgi:DNA-binding winged helix-turn-helix (wHTH) protein